MCERERERVVSHVNEADDDCDDDCDYVKILSHPVTFLT